MGKVRDVLRKVHTACKRLETSANSNWKRGTGRDMGYDDNEPLLFMETENGEPVTISKDPYEGLDEYIWEFDAENGEYVNGTANSIDDVITQLNRVIGLKELFGLSKFIKPTKEDIMYIDNNSFVKNSNNQQLEAVETVNETIDGVKTETSANDYQRLEFDIEDKYYATYDKNIDEVLNNILGDSDQITYWKEDNKNGVTHTTMIVDIPEEDIEGLILSLEELGATNISSKRNKVNS